MAEITAFQKAKVLSIFLKYANENDNVEFSDEIYEELSTVFNNCNLLEQALYNMSNEGSISYMELGEEGFKPIIVASITSTSGTELYHQIQKIEAIFEQLKNAYSQLENKVEGLYTFNPKAITEKIEATSREVIHIERLAQGSELLKPLAGTLFEIKKNLVSIANVTNNYEDVYKNIIKPIQEESKSGVKATVKWAVISIIISTLFSWFVSNYASLSLLVNKT
ncbi:hypothetical protein [Pantoea agglomerans]|uniref:hypothetical protein n=1 Tax=Enterobacter agglomerans TaxID=549 RepID=UPI00057D8287|nr:hypothetical protein [Pantoea agglomerans]KIC86445.1 hypothetical protein RN49_13785 [Pantoea agglomerans]